MSCVPPPTSLLPSVRVSKDSPRTAGESLLRLTGPVCRQRRLGPGQEDTPQPDVRVLSFSVPGRVVLSVLLIGFVGSSGPLGRTEPVDVPTVPGKRRVRLCHRSSLGSTCPKGPWDLTPPGTRSEVEVVSTGDDGTRSVAHSARARASVAGRAVVSWLSSGVGSCLSRVLRGTSPVLTGVSRVAKLSGPLVKGPQTLF